MVHELRFTIKNLDYTYEDGSGVHIKNLSLPMGSIIGVVGENGAGKSTFVR
ncbi:MAG: ATP-binding cassette domain-containing protein [Oribacterium sp.]|nr:ATP-binding cassette domain-containing protein [Oribacterium sp.]